VNVNGYGKYMTETQFGSAIMDLAKFQGWRVVHFRPALTQKGWRTAMSGDRGFPDMVLARDGVVLIVELKAQHGRLGEGQPEWAKELGACYRIWRPGDIEQIKNELRRY
jgi:hypothetical protein